MRYFIHLAYEGSKYHGWQRQQNTSQTIQERIEKALFKLFKKKVIVFGCGRTDTGVHASQYVLHINLDEAPTFDLKFRLNLNLPSDIAVYDIVEVTDAQHAQYHASARTYDYFIHWKKDPALFRYSSFYEHKNVDFDVLRQAVALIRNTQNFKALCKQPDLYKNTWCKISASTLYVNESEGRLRFSITANRFLRGMVRYIVFFLLEVSTDAISLAEFADILTLKKQYIQKRPALPNGLFLSKVEYPFVEFDNKHQLIRMLKSGLERVE